MKLRKLPLLILLVAGTFLVTSESYGRTRIILGGGIVVRHYDESNTQIFAGYAPPINYRYYNYGLRYRYPHSFYGYQYRSPRLYGYQSNPYAFGRYNWYRRSPGLNYRYDRFQGDRPYAGYRYRGRFDTRYQNRFHEPYRSQHDK